MPHTNPEESKRGAGVPRSRARAARTAAPLSEESAGTHTALDGDPSPKSTTTATDVDEAAADAHGVAPAGAAGAAHITGASVEFVGASGSTTPASAGVACAVASASGTSPVDASWNAMPPASAPPSQPTCNASRAAVPCASRAPLVARSAVITTPVELASVA